MSYRIDILDSSGVKVAQLDGSECVAKINRKINSEWTINLVYPIPTSLQGEDKSVYITAFGARVRVVNLQDTTDTQTFVIGRHDKKRNDDGTISVVAQGNHLAIWTMTNEVIKKTWQFTECPVSFILSKILSYSVYNSGTVSSSANRKVTISIAWESVLSALTRLMDAAYTEWDLDVSNGEIDVYTELGSTSKYIYIRPDKNLLSIQKTQYDRDVRNKIFGVGGDNPPVTIAGTRHKVYSVTGQVITVDHNYLVPENDAWNPVSSVVRYGILFTSGALTGSRFEISDCAVGAIRDTITVVGTISSVVAGDRFVMVQTDNNWSTRSEVNFIRSAASITSYGEITAVYRDSSISGAINLVNVPDLTGTYTGGVCEGWTKVGTPTASENTNDNYVQQNEKSQKIIGDADGDGISQQIVTTSGRYYRLAAWVYISAGTVKVQINDGTNTFSVSKTKTGWQKFEIAERLAGTTATISILQSGATEATFYVDAVQVTEGALERSFTVDSNTLALWKGTFNKVQELKNPRVEYRCNFVDLNRAFPGEYEYENINLGDTVTVSDYELGITNINLRVTSLDYDIFNPELTQHTVSNVRE